MKERLKTPLCLCEDGSRDMGGKRAVCFVKWVGEVIQSRIVDVVEDEFTVHLSA